MVRHWFPALGDPYRIHLSLMMGYFRQIVKIEKWKLGDDDSAAAHAAELAEKIEKRRLRRERLKHKQ